MNAFALPLFILVASGASANVIKRQAAGAVNQAPVAVGSSVNQTFKECSFGEVITQQDTFKYQCTNDGPKFVGCVGSELVGKSEFRPNETKTIDGFWYKCIQQNEQVQYLEEPRCKVGGKYLHVNESGTVGNVIIECASTGPKLLGCSFLDDKGQQVKVKVGESAQVGGVRIVCQNAGAPSTGGSNVAGPNANASDAGGSSPTGTLPTASPTNASSSSFCESDGQRFNVGDTWTAKHFRYVCNDGNVKITACIIDESNELPVGQTVAKFGLLHHCIQDHNRVSYRSEICGNNVKCNGTTASNNTSNLTPATTGVADNTTESTEAGDCADGRKAGETWVNGNFKSSCKDDGSTVIIACITETAKEIGPGQTLVADGQLYKCTARNNGLVFQSLKCGGVVQCNHPTPNVPRVGNETSVV